MGLAEAARAAWRAAEERLGRPFPDARGTLLLGGPRQAYAAHLAADEATAVTRRHIEALFPALFTHAPALGPLLADAVLEGRSIRCSRRPRRRRRSEIACGRPEWRNG